MLLPQKVAAQPFQEVSYAPEKTQFALFAPNDAKRVTLRSNSKSNHPVITYTDATSGITTTAQMNIKYIDFECGGMSSSTGVFAFSKE